MSGLIALLAALLGFASCGAVGTRVGTSGEVGVARAGCGSPGAVEADVDGDGREDTVLVEEPASTNDLRRTLAVCFADGRRYEMPSPGSVLTALDVNGDRDWEVATGVVNEDRTIFTTHRWNGTRLVVMPGLYLSDDSPGVLVETTFGCAPPRAVVQVDVAWAQGTAVVRTLTVDEYRVVSESKRAVRIPAGADRATYASSLVKPCPTLRGEGGPGS